MSTDVQPMTSLIAEPPGHYSAAGKPSLPSLGPPRNFHRVARGKREAEVVRIAVALLTTAKQQHRKLRQIAAGQDRTSGTLGYASGTRYLLYACLVPGERGAGFTRLATAAKRHPQLPFHSRLRFCPKTPRQAPLASSTRHIIHLFFHALLPSLPLPTSLHPFFSPTLS